jgi:dTDP-4-dehydrorhamnose 3,5-epimerase
MRTAIPMERLDLGLPGAFELRPRVHEDARGRFVKTYHETWFRDLGLRTDWREEYSSSSAAGVLRGLHFQAPPAHHAKLVSCILGEVLDVVLDLRAGPGYGRVVSRALSAARPTLLYLPEGLAHGFLALTEGATLHYKVTSVHAPERDQGLLWSSIPFDWPVQAPLLSPRDAAFPPFPAFATPFRS